MFTNVNLVIFYFDFGRYILLFRFFRVGVEFGSFEDIIGKGRVGISF